MSGSSWKHYYEEQSGNALAFDRPVSAFSARIALDNVAHLVDVSPVYRVNWVSQRGVIGNVTEVDGDAATLVVNVTHEFPTTVLREWKYPNYDVRVAASVTSGVPMAVVVKLSTASSPLHSDMTDPDVLGILSDVVDNATPAWVLDGQIISDDRNTTAYSDGHLSNTEIGDNAFKRSGAYIVKAKLTVQLRASFDPLEVTDQIRLWGVQVREYVNNN